MKLHGGSIPVDTSPFLERNKIHMHKPSFHILSGDIQGAILADSVQIFLRSEDFALMSWLITNDSMASIWDFLAWQDKLTMISTSQEGRG